jgi:hypothetical protein
VAEFAGKPTETPKLALKYEENHGVYANEPKKLTVSAPLHRN